jgi:hypothetical protein
VTRSEALEPFAHPYFWAAHYVLGDVPERWGEGGASAEVTEGLR